MRGGQVRVLGLSCFKMRRMVLHPEACTLVREWNLCTLSFEFYQTPTLRSAVIGNRSVWEFGCERERGRMAMCGGNICFKATRGPCLCVWPCVSKVGLGSLPRTTRCPWHQQEDVTIKHSPIAPRKRAVLFPWITLAFTNTHHSQTHKLMLLCWAPYFLALGLWRSTGVHLSGLHDCSTGSVFQIRSCSLSHIPPTLGCTLTTIILMFILHTHMQTQAKKKNAAHVHPQTQMKAEASMRQNTQRHRHSNSPPGFICINSGLLELCSRPAFQCLCFLFFSVVLNNSCLAPVDLSLLVSLYSPLSHS